MNVFVALLRAVNVGGSGKLPMQDLRKLCEDAGFAEVRTWIASGNVVFRSGQTAGQVKALLESALEKYAGKPVGVAIRAAAEMQAVLDSNPFSDLARDRTVAIFLDAAPAPDALDGVTGLQGERIELGTREIYVHYGSGMGMGRSKLRIPAARNGTARNINTVAKLAEMAAG
ncbi:MAG TPA: DUF1697 domain-containing protein [Gallionellaceae bacterium]|nr:DUF1697 domain-containing protein [Gallionellaceae bacterium]